VIRRATVVLSVLTTVLVSCTPASPTAAPPIQTVIPAATQAPSIPTALTDTGVPTPTETTEPSPTATREPTPTAAPVTATQLPEIRASCYPDASAPLEDLVILRGPEHLFDPSCQASGGVGDITASWDIDRDGNPESTDVDPPPLALEPGEYDPVATFADEAGQVVLVELPRIVKVGEPDASGRIHGVYAHLDLAHGLYANDAEIERACQFIVEAGFSSVKVGSSGRQLKPVGRVPMTGETTMQWFGQLNPTAWRFMLKWATHLNGHLQFRVATGRIGTTHHPPTQLTSETSCLACPNVIRRSEDSPCGLSPTRTGSSSGELPKSTSKCSRRHI